MADESLAELLKTQKSLTEWLDDIRHTDAERLRVEDNLKRERLNELNKIIGLPFDKPVQFKATELTDSNTAFHAYLKKHGDDLCALRLLPTKPGLPKLRMRGKSVCFAFEWFKEQEINPNDYTADFVPHPPDYSWSTIFIVNHHGIQGEIIYGGHHLLTQGFYPDEPPILFHYDFRNWSLSRENADALNHLQKLIAHLYVPDKKKQQRITSQLDGSFSHNYLNGYFESTDSSVGTWFIDYNRVLGAMYGDLNLKTNVPTSKAQEISGRTGSKGSASGPVRIVSPNKPDPDFPAGAVLVSVMTTPDLVPLMQRAAAIVTDQGGILSHAAIVSRELGKPCIVGTGNATTKLKNEHFVEVDADRGIVTIKEQ